MASVRNPSDGSGREDTDGARPREIPILRPPPCCREEEPSVGDPEDGQKGEHIILSPGSEDFKCSEYCKSIVRGGTKLYTMNVKCAGCKYHINKDVLKALRRRTATYWFVIPSNPDPLWFQRCGQMIDCRREFCAEVRLENIYRCGFRLLLLGGIAVTTLPSRFQDLPFVEVPDRNPCKAACIEVCHKMNELRHVSS